MSPRRKVLYLEIDIKRAREKQREAWRKRKARERATRTTAEIAAQKAREDAMCITSARIEPHLDRSEPEGCWLWRGGYVAAYAGPRPIVRAGQYGRVYADVATWLWWNNKKELPRGARPKRDCGNLRCVAPHHALMTNAVVERAKRRHGRPHGDLREQETQQAGCRTG